MDREILFHGKCLSTGEWVEGFAYEHEPPLRCFDTGPEEQSRWFIVKTAFADWGLPRNVDFIEVDPDTIGQYTGLQDKNKKKIFEGDILKGKGSRVFVVEYFANIAGFVAHSTDDSNSQPCMNYGTMVYYEVIGNIYDNPEIYRRKVTE